MHFDVLADVLTAKLPSPKLNLGQSRKSRKILSDSPRASILPFDWVPAVWVI